MPRRSRTDFVFPAPVVPKEILEREFFMEKIFKLKENGATVRTEIVAGLDRKSVV